MSRQQLIALAILVAAVITVYTLGIVMAADVLGTLQARSEEPSTGPPAEQSLPSPYPPTWTPTLTLTPQPTDTRIPTWTPEATRTPTLTPPPWPTATLTPEPPTSTPVVTNPTTPAPPPALPTKAPSATPGRLVFEADDDALVAGECATLYWIVDDARSVRLEGKDVDWQDSKEVCPTESETYTLKVVLKSGKEIKLEVEIEVFPPTPTITNTPTKTATPTNTRTPKPTNTATHTPTATPTPTDTPVPTDTPIPTDTPTNVPEPDPTEETPPTEAPAETPEASQ